MKFISSRENPFFKQLIKLGRSAQERRHTALTLLDGIHLISAYQRELGQPQCLILSETACDSSDAKRLLADTQRDSGWEVVVLADRLFATASQVQTPTGLMALISIPKAKDIHPLGAALDERFSVLLEAIQNPGNLGSILRSAAAAGAGGAYLSEGCADAWSPVVLRAAMGAHFLLHIHEQANIAEVARTFNGRVIATSLRGKTSLYQTVLTGPVAFIFGNEGAGLSKEVLATASEQIRIPMPGGTESLNAAAAAAVCFFERVRQMKTTP